MADNRKLTPEAVARIRLRAAAILRGETPVEATPGFEDPIVQEVIDSLRFELENAHEKAKYLEDELRKARGGSDDE
jgi:hypothetical protein